MRKKEGAAADMNRKIFTAAEIAAVTGGRLLYGSSLSSKWVSDVVIDSRAVKDGSLFAALHGERTDGHKHLKSAVNAGAKVLLVELQHIPRDSGTQQALQKAAVVVVDDTLKALQQLASAWVATHNSLTRIAITGSSGKTTTKEMISAILSELGSTVKTPGNYNSEIGLPLSLFNIESHHQFGVFEMGISAAGEMDRMLEVYSPEYSMMTNVGTAHIANFGSMEAIAREKSKIFHTEVRRGYINENNVWKGFLRDLRSLDFREFGREGTRGFQGAESLGLQGWRITYENREFHLKHVGLHNLLNALGAIALTRDIGAEPAHIAHGLESLNPLPGRSRIMPGKVTVIEDSYNANTDSSGKILDYMRYLDWKGRKAVVLGSMKDLGKISQAAHTRLGIKVKNLSPSAAFLYGKEMESAYRVLKNSHAVQQLLFTESYDELEHAVSSFVHDGDLLLLKGSRAMQMERLLVPLGLVS